MKDYDDTILKAEIDEITKNIDNILKEIENHDFIQKLASEQKRT